MGYWKTKVLPTIKKVFDPKGGARKAAAAEAIKSFDGCKEEIEKEFETNKEDLRPKVLEIYEASSVEVKTVVKERKEADLKKHSAPVKKFLEELAKIDFPGSKHASEASSKSGPVLVSSVVFYVFEKVSIFVPAEEPKVEAPLTESAPEPEPAKEKELVVEIEEKKDEKKEEIEIKGKEEATTGKAIIEEVVEEVKVVAVEVKEVEVHASEPEKPKHEGEGGEAPKA